MDTLRLFPANLLKWSKVQPSWTWTSEHYIWLRHHFSVSLNSFLPLMWFFFKIWHIKNLLRVHIQGWVQVLFSIPGRQQCEWVQLTEIPWHSDGLITSQIPLLHFTAPLSNTSNALSHTNKWALNVLLMHYRFSLLPWCFTMHPVHYHQIFSMHWLGLMHCNPWAVFKRLIRERKLGLKRKLY